MELSGFGQKGRIIGVVSDYNVKSLRTEVGSMVIHLDDNLNVMIVKTGNGDMMSTIQYLEDQYRNPPGLLNLLLWIKLSLSSMNPKKGLGSSLAYLHC